MSHRITQPKRKKRLHILICQQCMHRVVTYNKSTTEHIMRMHQRFAHQGLR